MKISLSKELYSKNNITKAIEDYSSLAKIAIYQDNNNWIVRFRDCKYDENRTICEEHNLQLIRVENSYARRYYHIKGILIKYFIQKSRM